MQNINYSAKYDVIVLGFGGAGATAARFAADNGAKVLLVDSAPYGHEGGNTRYAAQLIATGEDYDKLKKYYEQLTAPMNLPKDIMEVYVKVMSNMREYVKKYLDVEPVSQKAIADKGDPNSAQIQLLKSIISEYPEFKGAETHDYTTVNSGLFNAALWKILRQKVLDRKDKIDVWLNSPALHLIQDPESKTIEGAVIKRDGKEVNVLAKNGVVLTVGGFENNKEMIQNYLGFSNFAPLGTVYNYGDGVKMAAEVGAKMWHMWNYESLGMLHGLSFYTPEGQHSILNLGSPLLSDGSVFVIADDGKRYFKEDEVNRHGHIFDHDQWRVPTSHQKIYLVFDETQLNKFRKNNTIPELDEKLISADSISELGKAIDVDSDNLAETLNDYNQFAKAGRDYSFDRDPEHMSAFTGNKVYAVRLSNNILNTQGGPERNVKAEIIDNNNTPIPHLFGAGELGGVCANQYQGGENLAECLIFGKIAGENVAKVDNEVSVKASTELNGINDLVAGEEENISVGKNQYFGSSTKGIGGKVVARVTYTDDKIQKVEIVENHESEDVAKKALKIVPAEIEKANSIEVDAVSGASATSRAIKEAVSEAIKKAKN